MDNDLAYTIIGCALKVHAKLGPGLLVQTYLKLANKPMGYLINFNADKLTIGTSIHRITNINYHE